MKSNTLKLAGGFAAAVSLTVGFSAQAATTPLYAGGSTLAEKVYRDLFNAYGSDAGGDLAIGVNTPPASPYNSGVEALYVGVGSGNAVKALDAYSPSLFTSGSRVPDGTPVASTRDFGPFFGTGTGASWAPGLSPAFPTINFAGSDNILKSSDVSAVASLGFGPVLQFPTLIAAIAVPFTPSAGWNPQGTEPTGGSSKVQLSTNTLCGIFTGKITTWNNAAITADNKNKVLGTGTITVVYRHDSSGTTFIFSNALLNQCGTTSHPISTYPVPDQWLTDNGITNTAPYVSGTSFFINVFNAGHLPANFYNNSAFAGVTGGASGSGGLQLAVDATAGSIGYVSPDFVQPVATGKDKNGNTIAAAANLQTYYTYSAKSTAKYVAPTATAASLVFSTVAPPSFSGSPSPASNPLNWGVTNPTPTNASAYPIAGFTFIDMYTCYASPTVEAALGSTTAGKLGLFRWYYGSSTENGGKVASILAADGFAQVPASWNGSIKELLFTSYATTINVGGKVGTDCQYYKGA
jgi:ABC-type phosphate transport system substrate-binding protein